LKKCSYNGCTKNVFNGCDECILHCEKDKLSEDCDNGMLSSFYYALLTYMAEDMYESISKLNPEPQEKYDLKIKNYLKGIEESEDTASKSFIEICNTSTVTFCGVFFPNHRDRDLSYIHLLSNIKRASFNRCKFNISPIYITIVEMFFNKCEFLCFLEIPYQKWFSKGFHSPFTECKFLRNVQVIPSYDLSIISQLDSPLFENCKFEEGLYFKNLKIKTQLFSYARTDVLEVFSLTIEDCEIEEKFILNDLKINSLLIKDSIFNFKVELKGNEIDEIKIINTNFNGLFDSFDTKYEKFYCFKSIYSDFVGFEDCKFSALATFKYVTFLSFTNFRNATFNQGLDLQTTNLKEAPNFLNIDVLSNNTNRETFRIIKDSFDKIGNHIEANKFFGREMCKYEEELPKKLFNQEKIIFKLNKLISNFGQSYIRPIILIVICTVLYSILVLGHENNWLYTALPVEVNNTIGFIADILNGGASNIIPFKNILKEGMEFVSLIFYIIFASLIWQTIVAVKRHTRR